MKIEIIPSSPKFEPLLEIHRPIPANKFLPDWYKKMGLGDMLETKFYGEDFVTAKKCPAIQDMVSDGFILPLWGKLYFKTEYDEEGEVSGMKYDFSLRDSFNEHADDWIGHHGDVQLGEMDINRTSLGGVMKLKYPFSFIVPKGYNLMFTDPFYHFRKDVRCLSGIVESDKWGQITFPFELLSDKFIIEFGTPFVHVYPMARMDEKFELDIRKGTQEEYQHFHNQQVNYMATRKTYKYEK